MFYFGFYFILMPFDIILNLIVNKALIIYFYMKVLMLDRNVNHNMIVINILVLPT